MPDVTGWPELYARRYLELAGFEVTTVKVQESDQPRGNVEGTEPSGRYCAGRGGKGDAVYQRCRPGHLHAA